MGYAPRYSDAQRAAIREMAACLRRKELHWQRALTILHKQFPDRSKYALYQQLGLAGAREHYHNRQPALLNGERDVAGQLRLFA